ncbi:MAG TPA: arsenite methyltransferase [Anaerolineaceae bacterium]|nr:arsenite methyltransferase [Anaerolineaceae bacterium]
MTSSNSSADYFTGIASDWDALRSGYFSEAVRAAAIAKAYLHPQMIVADVGAGTGFMAAGLAPLVRHVHVLDGSAEMLEQARKNLSAFTNVEFKQADGLALPLREASVDAVFANMYLHHCPDPLAAIEEMVSILRPGGRLVITDLNLHNHAWLRTEMADLWLGFDRGQVRAWFEQAGLVNVVIDCTGQNCRAEAKDAKEDSADIGIFIATGTRHVPAHAAVQSNYGQRATEGGCCGGDSSCCSSGSATIEEVGTVVWDSAYTTEQKEGVPAEAAEISLGCGNPIAMAGLQPGETVLDIGSGGGIDVFLAARKVGPAGFVWGVDMTPAMLQRARKTASDNGFTNVKFRHGMAEKLPFEDGMFDVILSNCVINLSEDKGKVFREAYRVLKSGGRLEIDDMVFGGPVLPEMRVSAAGWSECISGALPEGEYIDLVRQAGFTQINVRRSHSSGSAAGVPVYSIQVSARKAS